MPVVSAAQVPAAQALHLLQLALPKSKEEATCPQAGRIVQLFS